MDTSLLLRKAHIVRLGTTSTHHRAGHNAITVFRRPRVGIVLVIDLHQPIDLLSLGSLEIRLRLTALAADDQHKRVE